MNGPFAGAVGLTVLLLAPRTFAEPEPLIAKGMSFLRHEAPRAIGERALAALALAKAGTTLDDPFMQSLIGPLRERCANGVYRNERIGGADNYEAAVVLMAFAALDPTDFLYEIQTIARYLIDKQTDLGAWDYQHGRTGDTSMSQYALLALWEASAAGVEVPATLWDRALYWLITRQDLAGGFVYHPRAPADALRRAQVPVTHSMSVAGAASMIICRSMLPFPGQRAESKGHALLIPVDQEVDPETEWLVTREMADSAIALAGKWIDANFTIDKPSGPHFYYLYGLERYAALADMERIGSTDWYKAGTAYLAGSQDAAGAWKATYPESVDTSFALLFLSRSMKKTLRKIQVSYVGRGTLAGGRGIPDPNQPNDLFIARRQARYRRALKAPVEDLLAALDGADALAGDEAQLAIELADPDELVAALAGNLPRLRKLARDDRPEVRQAAVTALARGKDYTVVPILIEALRDPNAGVYKSARDGLRLISRKLGGFGLPDKDPSPQALDAAIANWTDWLNELRIEIDPHQEFDDPTIGN